MFFYDILFILVFQLLFIISIMGYKLHKMNERIIINTVLSKLDFYPNHYKIIKKNNKIYIAIFKVSLLKVLF